MAIDEARQDRGFPEVEALSREVCSLPIYPELDEDEIDYVIETVKAFHQVHA
jgi:dTDP-4-amino-4,6-dideoxygalactose transaminase